ncbi:hypothetical protein PhCBS80983_g01546 [Powellomyces hirtus]|uniref:Uncharacterized protein n=1 Tax=Powellomyces hirtus TaxID=109895 RepID=A0A507EAI6_9FUNG|nr:hypothetical protein PhCBS80983_g01546 [Powellomyces hirtus]
MNNLGSYLAAKVALSKAAGSPNQKQQQQHRATTPASGLSRAVSSPSPASSHYQHHHQSQHAPSLHRAASTVTETVATVASSSSGSNASTTVSITNTSNTRGGPLATSPTPTTSENSPVFSPLRGLWGGGGGAQPSSPAKVTPKASTGGGGGLLDAFEFEFESLDPGIAFGGGAARRNSNTTSAGLYETAGTANVYSGAASRLDDDDDDDTYGGGGDNCIVDDGAGCETPRPIPSAPNFDQIEETGGHYGRGYESGSTSLGFGIGKKFNDDSHAHSSNSAFAARNTSAGATTMSSNIQTELANVKDLVLRLLDAQVIGADAGGNDNETTITAAAATAAAFEPLREQLTAAIEAIQDAARGITEAGEGMSMKKEDGVAENAPAPLPPHADLEAAVVELTESMEMRTSKIAKMVHELLQHRTATADQADLKTVIQTSLDSLTQQVHALSQQQKQPETGLALSDKLTSVHTLTQEVMSTLVDMQRSLPTPAALDTQIAQLASAQRRQGMDLGQIMTMVAEGNQKAAGARDEGLRSVGHNVLTVLERQKAAADALATVASDSTKLQEMVQKSLDHRELVTLVTQMQRVLVGDSRTGREQVDSLQTSITAHHAAAFTKSDAVPVVALLEDIKLQVSAAAAAPPLSTLTRSSSIGDRLDRPTTNMITSINDKLIHLSRLIDHVQETQTTRFSSVDERLQAALPGGGGNGDADETDTQQMITLHKLTDIRNSMENVEERLGRVGREAQTRHDVVDGRLERIADQLKYMHRTITKLVQVGMLGNGDEACATINAGSESVGGQNNSSNNNNNSNNNGIVASLSDQRALLGRMRDELVDIKEQLADDVTGDRMKDLLAMFAISQDTHSAVAEKVERIEKMTLRQVDAVAAIEKQVGGVVGKGTDGTAESADQTYVLLREVASQLDRLGPATSTHSSSNSCNSEILRLVESIHSCLVSYLPIDLDSRLTSIQSSLTSLSRSSSPQRPGTLGQHPQPPTTTAAPKDLRELLIFHQELAQREHATSAALDSIQHSLARVLDCFDAHGLFANGKPAGVPQLQPQRPVASSSVMDVTELKEIRDAVMEIRRATVHAGPAAASGKDNTTAEHLTAATKALQVLQHKHETVSEELAHLFDQRDALLADIRSLEEKKMQSTTVALPRRPKASLATNGRMISCPPGIHIPPASE